MSDPSWLSVGTTLTDPDGEAWQIYKIEYEWVWVEHSERGGYELRRSDLIRWVNRDAWSVDG